MCIGGFNKALCNHYRISTYRVYLPQGTVVPGSIPWVGGGRGMMTHLAIGRIGLVFSCELSGRSRHSTRIFNIRTKNQCFGSGSRREKNDQKKERKKLKINVMFWSAGCSFWRAEGFSCSLNVLYGGLGISELQILIKKIEIFFVYFFSVFGHRNPGSGLVFSLKCWIRIRIQWIRIRNASKKIYSWNKTNLLCSYIAHMESKGAHLAGIAKIVPPENWKPRR